MHAETSGPNAYRCVANLICRGGAVRNNECVCPKGFVPKQTGTNIFACVRASTGGPNEGSTGAAHGSTEASPQPGAPSPTLVIPQVMPQRLAPQR
jgi:hypothetical protein